MNERSFSINKKALKMTHAFDRGAGFLVIDDLDRPIPSPEGFSEEQWEFKKVARDFMDREVIPHAEALEKKDLELMQQLMLKGPLHHPRG